MNIRSVLCAAVLIVPVMTGAGHAQAAGFDCKLASSKIEKLICADPELSKLDGTLKELYDRIQGETRGVDGETGKVIDPVAKEEVLWIKTVRDKCRDTACLKSAYSGRIADMRKTWADALGSVDVAASTPAGDYSKTKEGTADLKLTDRGNGRWEARIEAGGIPRGGATAGDCNFLAIGTISGDTFKGRITVANWVGEVSDGEKAEPGQELTINLTPNSATISDTIGFPDLCPSGNGVIGRYSRK